MLTKFVIADQNLHSLVTHPGAKPAVTKEYPKGAAKAGIELLP